MAGFSEHEIVVLSSALDRLNLHYCIPEIVVMPGERITTKALRTVFIHRYPNLVVTNHLEVMFMDLMRKMKASERVEVATWYLEQNELYIPECGSHTDHILTFASHLTVLAKILMVDGHYLDVKSVRNHEEECRIHLVDFWVNLRDKHLASF